ncbi:MAG: hypothetical protein KBS95_08240 [Alistipes sp.]|nr:hypothetical protein [Candidatus Alistipes equi]
MIYNTKFEGHSIPDEFIQSLKEGTIEKCMELLMHEIEKILPGSEFSHEKIIEALEKVIERVLCQNDVMKRFSLKEKISLMIKLSAISIMEKEGDYPKDEAQIEPPIRLELSSGYTRTDLTTLLWGMHSLGIFVKTEKGEKLSFLEFLKVLSIVLPVNERSAYQLLNKAKMRKQKSSLSMTIVEKILQIKEQFDKTEKEKK